MDKLSKSAIVKCFAALTLTLGLYGPAYAGNILGATIVRISANTNPSGVVAYTIFTTGTDTNIGCNSGVLMAMSIDASTPGGKAGVATSLVAQASGQTITLLGAGNCNVSGNTETAGQVSIP